MTALPKRLVRELRDYVRDYGTEDHLRLPLLAALDRALAHSKASRFRYSKKAAKRAKKKTKAEETRDIRAAVFARAGGKCEVCGCFDASSMDHFWGRGKAQQSVENCWALCLVCDRNKTLNHAGSDWWLSTFRNHCETHGYADQALKASRRLNFVTTRKELGRAAP